MEEKIILEPQDIETDTEARTNRFYNDLKASPNNFSFWFPKVVNHGMFCPDSVIVPVPKEVMISFFMERPGDSDRIKSFIRETLIPAIPKDFGNRVFIKNGCFSNKFKFKWCTPELNEDALYKSILNINMDSFCYDTGGNTEIVVRRIVGADDNAFKDTIYEGMRLRPEIRVFYDFDNKKVLYTANYWDWDYCHDHICYIEKDKEVYERVYPAIKDFYFTWKDSESRLINEMMKDVKLEGIWSIDMMYAENRWWLIDMALGFMSAYWDPEKVKLCQ